MRWLMTWVRAPARRNLTRGPRALVCVAGLALVGCGPSDAEQLLAEHSAELAKLRAENSRLTAEVATLKKDRIARQPSSTKTESVDFDLRCPIGWERIELEHSEWLCRAQNPPDPSYVESCNLARGPAGNAPVAKQLENALSKAEHRTSIHQVADEPIVLGGLAGQRLIYDYLENDNDVRAFVSTVVKDGTRFVLTCAGLRKNHETFALPAFKAIEQSLTLTAR